MTGKLLSAAAVVGLGLLCAQAAVAEPMRCSAEQKLCVANCTKSADHPTCLANCGRRQFMCVRTGCWDNGVRPYCGLLRQ